MLLKENMTKIIEKKKSKHNGEIEVIKDFFWGTHLKVGGLTQSGGIVESFWKQTLKRIHNSYFIIHNSLILGLGGGSAAKWVRKFWLNCQITGVDIDPAMVELGKKYLGLDRFEIEIEIADAYQYIKYNIQNTKFDLILVDLYLGDQFPEKFESEKFLGIIYKLLSDKGLAVFNRLYFGGKRTEAIKFGKKLEKVFSKVEYYYPQANLMFICSR